jgi:hypothetical protein
MTKLLTGLLLLASSAFAAPNLTGDWKLNLAKSQYGLMPPPLEVTDGKLSINKMTNGEAKGTAHWEGDALIIESSQQNGPAEIKSRETWTLSSDGKTLTILTHLTIPQQGELDVKQVFDKQ